jgi:hypothetical protein
MALHGNKTKSVQAEHRRYKSFALKMSGKTYREVGLELSVSSKTAFKDVQRVLKEQRPPQEEVEYFRNVEVTRLEVILNKIWPKVEAGDYQAIDRAIKISRQIAELTGANSPEKLAFTDKKGNDLSLTIKLDRDTKEYDGNGRN